MGTNFYLQRHDPKTKRCHDMHICKTSGGWTPSMHGYKMGVNIYDPLLDSVPEIRSWREWKLFLLAELSRGSLIFDEYDEQFTYEEFVRRIEQHQEFYQTDGKNHAEMMLEKIQYDIDNYAEIDFSANITTMRPSERELRYYWVDDEGYSFSAVEFS